MSEYLNEHIDVDQYAAAVINLTNFALKDCGGSRVCAQVLLSAYNGDHFQLDITDLGLLHGQLYSDAILVIRARTELNTEPHLLIKEGDAVFKELQKQWGSYHVKCRALKGVGSHA